MYNNMDKNNMTRQKLGDLINEIIWCNKDIGRLEIRLEKEWGRIRPNRELVEEDMRYIEMDKEQIKKIVEQLNLIKI